MQNARKRIKELDVKRKNLNQTSLEEKQNEQVN